MEQRASNTKNNNKGSNGNGGRDKQTKVIGPDSLVPVLGSVLAGNREADAAAEAAHQRQVEAALAAKEREHQKQIEEMKQLTDELEEKIVRREESLDQVESEAHKLEDEKRDLQEHVAKLEVCTHVHRS